MVWMNFIVLALIALFVLWQFYPVIQARNMRGRVAPNMEELLDDDQKSLKRLLIYFSSPQCGMCKTMTTDIDELQATHKDIIKVNVIEHIDIARKFGILGTPSLALVEDGKIAGIKVGAKSKQQILAVLKQ